MAFSASVHNFPRVFGGSVRGGPLKVDLQCVRSPVRPQWGRPHALSASIRHIPRVFSRPMGGPSYGPSGGVRLMLPLTLVHNHRLCLQACGVAPALCGSRANIWLRHRERQHRRQVYYVQPALLTRLVPRRDPRLRRPWTRSWHNPHAFALSAPIS